MALWPHIVSNQRECKGTGELTHWFDLNCSHVCFVPCSQIVLISLSYTSKNVYPPNGSIPLVDLILRTSLLSHTWDFRCLATWFKFIYINMKRHKKKTWWNICWYKFVYYKIHIYIYYRVSVFDIYIYTVYIYIFFAKKTEKRNILPIVPFPWWALYLEPPLRVTFGISQLIINISIYIYIL